MTLPHSLSTARRLAGRALNVKFTFWTGKPFFSSSSLVPFDFAQKPVHHLSPSPRFFFCFRKLATYFAACLDNHFSFVVHRCLCSFMIETENFLSAFLRQSLFIDAYLWLNGRISPKVGRFENVLLWRRVKTEEREKCWYESWILKQCSFHRSMNDDLQLLYRLEAVK